MSTLATVERVLPYVLPAIGGAAGVIWVNTHKMDQLNPMIWIGGGILLGFVTAKLALSLLSRIG
ncbi:hypothetical protein [Aliiroseovarius marinus]|uniref:hypothetical protein n=1 Tax=Aliiroseovarius marinus TaxID=2500159 RepID=UPI003D7C9964